MRSWYVLTYKRETRWGWGGRGGHCGSQGSPDLQESTAKQNSTVCIIGVNRIAPNFVTLVATYIYMSFSFLKTSQRDGYICHSAAKGWSSGFLAVGHLNTVMYSQLISNLRGFTWQVENACWESWVEQEFWKEYTVGWDRELEVVLTCIETTLTISCTDYVNIRHISTSTGGLEFVEWAFFCSVKQS